MGLVILGLSHKTAPVELREHLAIPADQLPETLSQLASIEDLQETVVLSTCNRMEIYARPKNNRRDTIDILRAFFKKLYSHPKLSKALYHYAGEDAVKHLFRVSSGLDSLVIGESEVLGQVKSAYQKAYELKVTGKITNVLFQRALFVGKQVRTQTHISDGASSVGSIAVQLAERIFGTLQNHRILLIGAGDIAELTARHLLSQKAGSVVVMNRTLTKARTLAQLLNGEAKSLGDLEQELIAADIVLSSITTKTDEPFIKKNVMEKIMNERKGKSIYFVDMGVPRNIDPDIHQMENAYVYNIDDLQELVEESLGKRRKIVDEAERIVASHSKEFYGWIQGVLEGRTMALAHGPESIKSL